MAEPRFLARAVLIDLDGTLLDTAPDLAAGVNGMLRELGRAALPLEEVARYVGKGAAVLVHRALTRDPEGRAASPLFERALGLFEHHYARENGRAAQLYPGVVEGLGALRAKGLSLGVVTNKPSAFTRPLLAATGLAQYFACVVSGDTLAVRKPDPAPMRHAAQLLGSAPEHTVAIGDSINDALAARAAGMCVMAVPYGYNEGLEVRSLDVDAIVETLLQAADFIDPL